MKALILALFFVPILSYADVSVPRGKQYAYAIYDVSLEGGATVVGGQNIIPLNVQLPAGIIITDEWVYINTQFAASGNESLAIQCSGNQDLMAFTTLKNIAADRVLGSRMLGNTFNGGAALLPASPTNLNFSQGFGSVPVASSANGCQVSVEIQGVGSPNNFTPYTSGKFTAIIEYFKL